MIALPMLLMLTASSPTVAGVVRMAQSTTARTDARRLVQPGYVLANGGRLETSGDGYAEFVVGRGARVRMSALTRVDVDARRGLRLGSGRIWVQTGREPLRVVFGRARVIVAPSSSAVVERAPTGITVAVRAGHSTLELNDETMQVPPGYVASAAERFETGPKVVRGGRALWELVVREAESALGDIGGLEAFVVAQALWPRILLKPGRVGDAPFAGYPDGVSGSDGGAAGLALEEAIRPPPFFDDEVPPKGPNVRVDVTFSEE